MTGAERLGAPPPGEVLGYRFQDPRWLEQALTHRSFLFDFPHTASGHNERLEFLGDAVVQLAVSRLLFERFPQSPEGVLTRLRAQLVGQPSLARLAREEGLDRALRLGKAAESEGARGHDRLLASALEAVVGAIFVDGGWEPAYRTVAGLVERQLERLPSPQEVNPKGALQERLAREGRPAPVYRLVTVSGQPHRRRFDVEVLVEGSVAGVGTGSTRKQAEQEAARAALDRLFPKGARTAQKEFAGQAEY